jgi:hypothetical protein
LQEAGIGLNGVKIRMTRDTELIGRDLYGYTHPNGRIIELYPDAFRNTETLIRTLGHERMHIYQARTFRLPMNSQELRMFEEAAYASEDMWMEFYRRTVGR